MCVQIEGHVQLAAGQVYCWEAAGLAEVDGICDPLEQERVCNSLQAPVTSERPLLFHRCLVSLPGSVLSVGKS